MLDPALARAAAEVIRSKRTKDPLDWFEANITEIPSSPRRGAYNRKVMPWTAAALEVLCDHETRRAVMIWGTQLGKSFTQSALACHLIANQPGPMMLTQDTQDNADDFCQNTFRRLISCCPPVDSILVKDSEKSDTLNFLNGVVCYVKSANNEANLQRRTLRYVIADEVWEYQPNRIDQVLKRVDRFEKVSKVVLASQGSEVGDELHREWMQTDRATWNFCCSSCGLYQPFVWDQIRFPEQAKSDAGWKLDQVELGTTYECAGCRMRLPDREEVRDEINEKGRFVAACAPRQLFYRGLHVPSMAGVSWGKLGVEMLKAAEAWDNYADPEPRKIFKQKRLGDFWSDDGGSFVADFRAGDYHMADPWDGVAWISPHGRLADKVPEGAKGYHRLRTMGVDKQLDHYFVAIRDWARDGSSRLVHLAQVKDGWAGLDAIATRFGLHRALVGVDSGFSATEVYQMTGARGWKAMKGFGQNDFAITQGVRRFYSEPEAILVPGGRFAQLIKFSNLAVKDMLYGMRLRKLHTFPNDAPEEYLAHMSAEVRVKEGRDPVWKLKRDKEPNHYFDAEVIALLLAIRWGIGGRDVAPASGTEVAS